MKDQANLTYKCRRCHKPSTSDLICQSCKNELLSYFEATSDWQTAFEMERAQLSASRYRSDDYDDDDQLYY